MPASFLQALAAETSQLETSVFQVGKNVEGEVFSAFGLAPTPSGTSANPAGTLSLPEQALRDSAKALQAAVPGGTLVGDVTKLVAPVVLPKGTVLGRITALAFNPPPPAGVSQAPIGAAALKASLDQNRYILASLASQTSAAPGLLAAFKALLPNASSPEALVTAWVNQYYDPVYPLLVDPLTSGAQLQAATAIAKAQTVQAKFHQAMSAEASSGTPSAIDYARALVPTTSEVAGVVGRAGAAVSEVAGAGVSGLFSSSPVKLLALALAAGAGVYLLFPQLLRGRR